MADTILKTPNYRSLVGGFFSRKPGDMSVKRTIRTNNPWALNISEWQKSFPGFVGWTVPDASPNANKTTIYETPEQGVAAGYELLRKYAAGGHDTVREIITRYGGGQDYSGYLNFVTSYSGLSADQHINLNDDTQLLRLAKAMMRYEAGKEIPWSDQQILYGIKLGRQYAGGALAPAPAPQPQVPTAYTQVKPEGIGFWAMIIRAIARLFGGAAKQVTSTRIMQMGDVGEDVRALQIRLRELGFADLVVDGEFGTVLDKAVRTFQNRENLDPDGEVGELTLAALNRPKGSEVPKPPLLPPPVLTNGIPTVRPDWYSRAEKEIGFREVGNNRGIEKYIRSAKTGSLGDPWCAIFINAMLEEVGVPGSRSAMARSFETHSNFTKLREPSLGCIITMWRGSPTAGTGHVFFYDGESTRGVRGIGGNEDNVVKRSFHDRQRITGYWWPKGRPSPTTGRIQVSDDGSVVTRSEV